ncbi:TPA: hypothetical protein JRS25_003709 [Escherichia coli]|nr:hypothetical protein [Escherichia coli]HAY3976986.1 hypothetical protein [Escherichia coli]HBB9210957.1 hypothetical protein [Escherichia coli]
MVTNEEIKNMNDEEFYQTARAELTGLPRAQRRAKERELKENIRLMKSFNPAQLRLIDAVTSERSKLECEQQISRYITIMDTCLSAYMYLKDENITEEEVLKELKIIDDLVTEYRDVLNDVYKENRGNDEMATKQIEKITKEVREKCEELVQNGMNQGKALVVLKSKFPTLSKAMLVNAYKKVKKEMKEEEKQIIAAAEHIFPEIKEEKTVLAENATTEIKEESKVEVKPESKKEEEPKVESKLKVVSKEIIVEGEFGKYSIDQVGVTVGELQFTSIADVEEYKADELAAFEKRIAEIKQVVAGEF